MATRGAANRGGGPATFVGGVRRFKLAWEEAELPSYGPPPSGGSGASRKMKLFRWVRTEERTDDTNNAVPRHPNLVPVDDASIPFKSLSRGAEAAADGAAFTAPAAPAFAAPSAAAAAAASGVPAAAAANGTANSTEKAAKTTAVAPMEAS